MKLFETWKKMTEMCTDEQQLMAFWKEYYAAETENYKRILGEKNFSFSGTVQELAESFGMEPAVFTGFIDGINTSLKEQIAVEELEEDSTVSFDIDLQKLYYNMRNAKAEWLYELTEWEDILTEEERKVITKQWRNDNMAVSDKVGRNEPCPCGSGKKYKSCCGKNE